MTVALLRTNDSRPSHHARNQETQPASAVSDQNPFSDHCDPEGYIPRRATEDILRSLDSHLRDGEPTMVLHGPAGIGKSMLLRVLEDRLSEERTVAYASIAQRDQPELCCQILGILGIPFMTDPAGALISAARAAADRERGLLLIIDDAALAPIDSCRQLVRAAESIFPRLSVIFGVCDGRGAEEFIEGIESQSRVVPVPFNQVMNAQESEAYVRLRLGIMRGHLAEVASRAQRHR
jgi:hypothetical protein